MKHWSFSQARSMAISLVALVALVCGAGPARAAEPGFPVTVSSCGQPVRFAAPPRRLVVHDLNMAEMALALGLRNRMVGVTGITGWYNADAAFFRALGNVPELAPKYPTLENILAVGPDLFLAGWYYGMQPGGEVTPSTLAPHGVATLVLTESCIHTRADKPEATLDLLYGDVLRLGMVFGRRAAAERLVAGWKGRVQAAALPALPQSPRVFIYDSGEDKPFTAGRAAMPHALVAAAGGVNALADVKMGWGTSAWEAVAERDPQFIVLLDYQNGQGPDHLRRVLEAHPAMRLTQAVREQRYIVLRYAELTPGPANIDAIEKIARALRAPR